MVHAIHAHHGDVEAKTVIACIVQAADAISAARPGARRENLENYIKRLEKLEEVASSFDGVSSCYAIQAGREIRIMVKPEVSMTSAWFFWPGRSAKRLRTTWIIPDKLKSTSSVKAARSNTRNKRNPKKPKGAGLKRSVPFLQILFSWRKAFPAGALPPFLNSLV